ncbi:MAG: hypothetical protein HQ595_01055, partial [Candidatus Omnitrophica bacterium]|nr:hypothetical protein [Candidatus Omnitrophota bacterium]
DIFLKISERLEALKITPERVAEIVEGVRYDQTGREELTALFGHKDKSVRNMARRAARAYGLLKETRLQRLLSRLKKALRLLKKPSVRLFLAIIGSAGLTLYTGNPLFLFGIVGMAVNLPDEGQEAEFVKLLDKAFPDAEEEAKKKFVAAFLENIPARMAKDRAYTEFLLVRSFTSALEALRDTEKLHFEFCERTGMKGGQVIVGFNDVMSGTKADIYDAISKAGADIPDDFSFTLDMPHNGRESKIVIEVIDLDERGERGRKLRPVTKSAIVTALKRYRIKPIIEYKGAASMPNVIFAGRAAYYDAGTEMDIAAIMYNIIPREARRNPEAAAKIIGEDINNLSDTIERILDDESLMAFGDAVMEEAKINIFQFQEDIRQELLVGHKPEKRIIRPPAAILLHRRIRDYIAVSKREAALQGKRGYERLLDEEVCNALEIFDEALMEETFYTYRLAPENATPGEQEEAVKREKANFAKIASELKQVEQDAIEHLTGEPKEIAQSLAKYIDILTQGVLAKIRVDGKESERLLPASVFIHRAVENNRLRIDTLMSSHADYTDTKSYENLIGIREILKRMAVSLSETEVAVKEFKPIPGTEKYVLFLKGYIMPSDVENFIRNERVGAIVTTEAGPTTHWVLTAKNLGVPVFFAVKKSDSATGEESLGDTLSIDDVFSEDVTIGDMVIIDDSTHSMIIKPDIRTLFSYKDKISKSEAVTAFYEQNAALPARTSDGKDNVTVYANVENETEAENAFLKGADGIGLVRTELWLKRDLKPVIL